MHSRGNSLTDRQTSAILIGVAVVWFILWYRKRNETERATLFGVGDPGTAPTLGEKAANRPSGVNPAEPVIDNLKGFARLYGLDPLQRKYGSGGPGFTLPQSDPAIERMRKDYGLRTGVMLRKPPQ